MAASRPGSRLGAAKESRRDGYGLYVYPNSFFQYEGEWQQGKKHGYGKLLFKDGSYYEGEFADGEITGNGLRYWASTGNTYSGQFLFGELHGHGVIQYQDSGKYEGEFSFGLREGHGLLTDKDGQTYEGCFHRNKKHGVGKMVFKNGDEYEGDWILDQRQGHGVLHCTNGTVYEGQWRNDTFNGQGSVLHCSGVTYDGLWLNGYPVGQAKKIVILGPEVIDTVPGSAHTFHIQLQNEEGEVSERENSRLLEISAGIRHRPLPANCKNSLYELIEQSGRRPIKSSFGFEYISYPLMVAVSGSQEFQAALPTVGKSGFTLPELPVPEGNTAPESGSKPLDGTGDALSNWDAMKKDRCCFAKFQRTERGRATFRNVSLAPSPGDVRSEGPHEEGGNQTSAKAPAEKTTAFQATVGDGSFAKYKMAALLVTAVKKYKQATRQGNVPVNLSIEPCLLVILPSISHSFNWLCC
ncbi:MORN repeat-containing protein 1 [Tiliqua scincoides]|uniref:MORN repeat-containing protein 1 n=1 Tax=Tiliqua scincoides TaxID=71010 RepID=UPI0034625824